MSATAIKSQQTKKQLEEFIQIYRSEPALWKVTCHEYKNRALKTAAYNRLVDKLRETDPEANRCCAAMKIHNILRNFRKELKKVKANPCYRPQIWYFQHLMFLCGAETSPESQAELAESDDETLFGFENFHEPFLDPVKVENFEMTEQDHAAILQITPIQTQEQPAAPPTVVEPIPPPPKVEDRYDLLGRTVAVTLRELKYNLMRVKVQKLINDVLFEAEMGTLKLKGLIEWMLSSQQPVLSTVPMSLPKDEDRHDIFGRTMALRMRDLKNVRQQLLAEKLINDVLFEAECNNLSANELTEFLDECKERNKNGNPIYSINK